MSENLINVFFMFILMLLIKILNSVEFRGRVLWYLISGFFVGCDRVIY